MKKYFIKFLILFLVVLNFIFSVFSKELKPSNLNLKNLKSNINLEKANLSKTKKELDDAKNEKILLNKKLNIANTEIENINKSLLKEKENYEKLRLTLTQNKLKEKNLKNLFFVEIETFFKNKIFYHDEKNKNFIDNFFNFLDFDVKKEINLKILKEFILENFKNLNELKNLEDGINLDFIKLENNLKNLKTEKLEKDQTKNRIISKNKEKDLIIKNKSSKIKKFEENIKNLEKNAQNMEKLLNSLIKKENKLNKKNVILKNKNIEDGKNNEFERLIQVIGKITKPLDGEIVVKFGSNKYFGYSTYFLSNGIQIKSKDKIIVRNVFPGKVVFCDNFGAYGKTVILEHDHDIFTVYAYLDEYFIKINQKVLVGDILGKVDKINKTLYFEIRYKDEKIDPKIWIKNI